MKYYFAIALAKFLQILVCKTFSSPFIQCAENDIFTCHFILSQFLFSIVISKSQITATSVLKSFSFFSFTCVVLISLLPLGGPRPFSNHN